MLPLRDRARCPWSSDEAPLIYEQVQREQYGGWLLRAEKVRLSGKRARNLPRPLPDHDGIDLCVLWRNSRAAMVKAAARDVVEGEDVD